MICVCRNLCGRLHRLHGNFTLPPFAPDARLKYHCTLYASSPDRVQSRSSQPGFSLTCRGRVLAYRCAGSAYRECTQVFGYSVVKAQEGSFHLSIGHFSKSFKMFLIFTDRRKSPLTDKNKRIVFPRFFSKLLKFCRVAQE